MNNRLIHRWLAAALGLPILFISTTGTLTTIAEIADPPKARKVPVVRQAPTASLPPIATLAPRAGIAVTQLLHRNPQLNPDLVTVEIQNTPAGVRVQAWATGADQAVAIDERGRPVQATLPGGKPLKPKLSSWLQDIHSGLEFGRVVQAVLMLSGTALAVLAITGVAVWSQMWSRLRTAGRPAVFWK